MSVQNNKTELQVGGLGRDILITLDSGVKSRQASREDCGNDHKTKDLRRWWLDDECMFLLAVVVEYFSLRVRHLNNQSPMDASGMIAFMSTEGDLDTLHGVEAAESKSILLGITKAENWCS